MSFFVIKQTTIHLVERNRIKDSNRLQLMDVLGGWDIWDSARDWDWMERPKVEVPQPPLSPVPKQPFRGWKRRPLDTNPDFHQHCQPGEKQEGQQLTGHSSQARKSRKEWSQWRSEHLHLQRRGEPLACQQSLFNQVALQLWHDLVSIWHTSRLSVL